MNLRFLPAGFLLAIGLMLSACTAVPEMPMVPRMADADYGQVVDAGYTIPAVPVSRIENEFLRQIVNYRSDEEPGTIIVDTPNKHLYYLLPDNRAVRYGIGVGREGFAWEGEAYVAWKQAWPRWHPPAEMVERQPELKEYAEDGMDAGLMNPLGARALYLYDEEGRDTLYRLHGTPEWNTIGTAASSGCIRLMNQDIIDLYERVTPGRDSKVIVLQ